MKPEVEKKKITARGLKNAFKLFRFIKPYGLEYTVGMVFLLGASAANLAFPKYLGELVNAGNSGILGEKLNRIALILAGVLLLQAIFSYFRTILFVNVTEKTLADIRQTTYDHLIQLPIKFFEKRRVGELNSRISSDISLLQETLTSTLADFVRQLTIIIGGVTLLALTSLKLTLFMLSVLPAVVILAGVFGRFIRRFSKEVQNEVAESNTIVEETLQGIQSVKVYTNERFEMRRYKKRIREIAQIGMKSGKYRGAFSSFIILGIFGSMVAVIWKGSTLLATGEIGAGEMFSFVLYSGFIGGSIGGLSGVYTRMQKFIGATEDLFKIYEENGEILSPNDIIKPAHLISGEIVFNDLSFIYPSRPEDIVINEINLSIRPNQLIALVGPSGAGKSTITALLLRLYEPSKGTILFDGKSSTEFPLSALRHQIALVPQDIFLFGGTIKMNIAYGKSDATEEEIYEAAKNANALEFIERLPQKFDTVVGERGTQLSGGQRQRVAIARAILKDPKVLILDEATSSLDSESEKLVQDALEKLMKGRTAIVIAHRLATVRKADQIFVLDRGILIEKGTHKQLMQLTDGMYRSLSELQFAG